MILEKRTYTVKPGTAPEYMAFYRDHGLEVQSRILGGLVGYFQSELGTLNQIVHLWRYDSLAERERRRAELAKDETWQRFLREKPDVLLAQDVQILSPADFSPLR